MLCSLDVPDHTRNAIPRSLATILSDNRLKVWDIASGKLRQAYADKQSHLSAEYTAIAFNSASLNSSSKRASTSASSLGLVALGTKKGVIFLWQLATGQVVHTLGASGEGHVSRITDLAFNAAGSHLYSASEDKTIRVWNVGSGECLTTMKDKMAVNKLCLSPDEQFLLSANTEISLWDLSSHKVVKRFSGHSSPVSALQFSPDGAYFASAGGERFVSMWNVNSSSKRNTAVHTFAMDSPPLSLHFNADLESKSESKEKKSSKSKDKGQALYHVAAVAQSGKLCIWQFRPSSSSSSSTSADMEITPEANTATTATNTKIKRGKVTQSTQNPATSTQGHIVRARFIKHNEVLLVRGSDVKPVFEQMSYMREDGSLLSSISLPPLSAANLVELNESNKRKAEEELTVTAPLPSLKAAVAVNKKARKGEADALTRSLAEQLSSDDSSSTALMSPDEAKQQQTQGKVAPKAGSLQTVLAQAVHTNDESLLDYCLGLGRNNQKLVKQTVERLPTVHVLPFLVKLVEKFQSQPSRGLSLVVWLKEVLKSHTSYLMSLPQLGQSMSQLYSTVDVRLGAFKKLLQLSGRLDLLMAQLNRRSASSSQALGVEHSQGPLNTYSEEDDAQTSTTEAADMEEDDDDDQSDDENQDQELDYDANANGDEDEEEELSE